MLIIVELKPRVIKLDFLERRASMGFGNERPKDRRPYEEYLKLLKKQVTEEYDG